MTKDRIRKEGRDGERGMTLLLMAFAIVGLIGAGSLTVDLGSALVTKAELQNVADSSSLAATRELALIYKERAGNTDYKTYTLTSADESRIQNRAIAYAAANRAGGISIVVGSDDIVPARYDIATGQTTPGKTGARAVAVTGRRDDVQNGQVQTALGRVLGIDQIAVTADSTAAISAVGKLKTGKGEFPIGLDEDWFTHHTCASPENVRLYPTSPGSCAGWHTFDVKPASSSRLRKIIEGIEEGSFQSPVTTAGQTRYEFVGGTIEPALNDLAHLFNVKQTGGTWLVNVPVYQSSGCANPNQDRLIVGFAKFRLTAVQGNPGGRVEGDVECGIFTDDEVAEGGGVNDFGTLSGIPSMIR